MTPESASKTEERKRVSTASNKRKREARSKETPASSVTKRTDDSVPSSNGKPSHDIVGPSGLCDRCKVIVIDIGKASLSTKVRDGEVVLEAPSDQDLHLGFELQDTYPEFPRLASSAAKGCRFCGFLKEEIGVEISQSVLREVDEMFGATQEEEITIDIKGLRYYWTRRFTGGLSQLWPNLRISTSSGRFSREMLLPFDIMTDFGTPVARFLGIQRRPVEPNIFDSHTMRMCTEWLRNCTRDHASCKAPTAPFIPTRLIYIGDGPFPSTPRLIITNQDPWPTSCSKDLDPDVALSSDLSVRYLAFSYCWGCLGSSLPSFRTTKENVHLRRHGISLQTLPKSFQHLFTLARGLGLRFVWIDSVCILQDDCEDLGIEIGRMGEVYAQAYLTVAFTPDISTSDGFVRRDRNLPVCKVPFAISEGHSLKGSYGLVRRNSYTPLHYFSMDVTDSRYDQRGWTFQERYLSRRVLFVCETMLHYECQELQHSENTAETFERATMFKWCPKQELDMRGSESLYKIWCKLVEIYTQRTLTYKSDKLPAIAGLAATMAHALQLSTLQDTYLAGLWKRKLVGGLLWCRPQACCNLWRSLDYRAPSWCWSAYDGRIQYPFVFAYKRLESQCSVIDVVVQSNDSHPFGRITGGYLKVTGSLAQIDSVKYDTAPANSRMRLGDQQLLFKGDRSVASGMLDCPGEHTCTDRSKCETPDCNAGYYQPQIEHDVWALLLANFSPEGRDVQQVGLIVTPAKSPNIEAEYRRIGIFWIKVNPYGPIHSDSTLFNACEKRTITII